ncbi:probable helicase senataxin [Chenopodium quinoa]|uniref:probable helicase senataxin n=1 Tax=Chenopodium quinoa TaxID=63459 RepID=UPI000B798D8D|nr:probable helicase senataxin [Chenopodium quinoa]XP_021725754.1 probable helicase senataxin [Chenopodium quinoa]
MMKVRVGKKEEGVGGNNPYLLDLVFSWTIRNVLNENHYAYKVRQIPDKFSSIAHYFNSFKLPLIEETRAEYCSGLVSISHAPVCEISGVWLSASYKLPTDLYYEVSTKRISEDVSQDEHYVPESGDIFAVTTRRPRSIEDLLKPDRSFHFAYVSMSTEDANNIEILSSEKIDLELLMKKQGRLFVTYLLNITTNLRIWKALNPDPQSKNLGLIKSVLQHNSSADDDCSICIPEKILNVQGSVVSGLIGSFGLNESQTEAILSSVCLAKCPHQEYNVKLIWGPPGTGKTKTVASLLFVLLKLKFCTTLTCAPTNIAVIQVAKKLVNLVIESLEYESYGLGDIVLFGNDERMKIHDHYELVDVFLKYRVKLLDQCLVPLAGWKGSLNSLISLLENPQVQYEAYLEQNRKSDTDKKSESYYSSDDESDGDIVEVTKAIKLKEERMNITKVWKRVIVQSVRENVVKNKKGLRTGGQGNKHSEEDGEAKDDEEVELCMTFEEFMRKTFSTLANRLMFCAEILYTHMPTSCLPLFVAKEMIKLVDLLQMTLEKAKHCNVDQFSELIMMKREEILAILKMLQEHYPVPRIDGNTREFCLDNARLLFCTASGAIKVSSFVDMVIIDEAAQLKECESAIPLQIPGLKNAILVGDDRQLPAMVRSKMLERNNFGRSLFQRLSWLGKAKRLLNIQYRMHPSISLFPNEQFYNNNIVDEPSVTGRSYVKNYLKGDMYGSYSFINVPNTMENFNRGPSPRNFEEAAVVVRIIAKLFRDYYCVTKQKVSVGVISPYKGQVGLLQEKFENKYTKHKEKFCINIRSIDGFQGGEEDIIIISTVRSNGNGSVGFLSNCQRTNVALTRARYCLWIVGSASTLGNSGSIWKSLVHDAKTRGCFYEAYDDIELIKNDFFGYLTLDKAKWKITFSNEFRNSISITNIKAQIRTRQVLQKIANGWRQSPMIEKPVKITIADPVSLALLKLYKIDENLILAWTVDIVKEETCYKQVIKVWDILPGSKMPNLAKNLSAMIRRCNVDFIHCCEYKSFEGNSVVPMSWPLHPPYNAQTANPPRNLGVIQGEPRSRARSVVSVWKPVQREEGN